MLRYCIIFSLFLFSGLTLNAQELMCEVSVVAPDRSKVKTDPKVFKTLENSISEFMNTRKWTTDVFGENEKIECSIFIAITDEASGGGSYSGSITVISKRPVYNSDYHSTVLNVVDNDFVFQYQEFQPLEFNENQFTQNLTHVLSFYAYLMIGMDYETFGLKGGEKYLQRASDIANVVSANEGRAFPGWKSYEKNQRNRYWVITHMLNSRYEPYRTGLYKYHREGLDNFYSDPVLARQNIKDALNELAKVSQDNPNLSIMLMWSESKRDELVGVFSEAPAPEKDEILKVLKRVDPINSDKYERIKTGGK
jgi:hypothetical protein